MVWKLFFDDGQSVKQKVGEIEKKDSSFVYIRVEGILEAIPISNIKRMEEIKND
jgi:hypothetical protein